MAGTIQNDDEEISAINVTPLVDVVLVLLVIFMITAPVIYQSAIQVDLPKAKSGQNVDTAPLEFTIRKSGELLMGHKPIDWNILDQKIKAGEILKSVQSGQPVVITADQAATHGTVVRLMDVLRSAGLNRFALNVDNR